MKQVNYVGTTVYAFNGFALIALWRKDAAQVRFYTETVVELARTHKIPMFAAWGAFLDAWSRWHLSGRTSGLEDMRNGLVACRAQGNGLYLPLLMTALAEAEAQAGELDTALATIDEAVAETIRHGQRWFEAETRRIRGEILLRRDPTNTKSVEEAFGEAHSISHKQNARVFELRAATNLAGLWRDQQKKQQAHDVLVPICEWFTDDVEFPDLNEARKLLNSLSW